MARIAKPPLRAGGYYDETDLLRILASGVNPDGTPYRLPGPVSEWSLTATATAAAATVTRPGEAGRRHYVTSVSGSFGAAQISLLTLSDGATVVQNHHVHNIRTVEFSSPVEITAGNAAAATLGAGAAGVVGAITITGFTV